jgi:flagellar biosynthetic protein FliP
MSRCSYLLSAPLAALVAVALRPSAAAAFEITVNGDQRGAGPLEIAGVLTLITLAPALLIMLTSFTRIVIVLSLMR